MTNSEAEARIMEIMQELSIEYYLVETWMGVQDGQAALYDMLKVHFKGDESEVLFTANEFEQPVFGLLKELEMLVMGETS